MWQRIREISTKYTSGAGLVLINHSSRLMAASKSFSQIKNYLIETFRKSLKSNTMSIIDARNAKLNLLEVSLSILNPDNVLKRGYTITSLNGKIIKAKGNLREDDVIDTRFSDGTLKSIVLG